MGIYACGLSHQIRVAYAKVDRMKQEIKFITFYKFYITEIKNAPAQMALKEREATRNTLKDYAIKGIIALILLGVGCYIGGIAQSKAVNNVEYEQTK